MRSDAPVPTTIDEYLAGCPRSTQAVLKKVRKAIRRALPGAEEVISYRIPAFKLHGRVVVYFAAWAEHYAVYPFTRRLEAAFRDEIAPYEVSGKGTIRFPYSAPVPTALIEGIAAFRAQEVKESAMTKSRAARKR
jgi:uncharacterized protein YdhG (YjbR/CyaY superfamily)